MAARVAAARRGDPEGYATPAELLADLRAVERCLCAGHGEFTAAGDLHDVLRQVEVFGFHFARLDVREHARVHRAALDEVFGTLGVQEGYAALQEAQRIALLVREIDSRRPVIPTDLRGFSPATREAIETFRVIRDALDGRHAGAVEATSSRAREGVGPAGGPAAHEGGGLVRAGGHDAALRIVPLFEGRRHVEARRRRWTASCASGPTASPCGPPATSRRS
jgi:phosphoenolpyruvate carboxylase